MSNATHVDLGINYSSGVLSACEDITGKEVKVYIYECLGEPEILVIDATIIPNKSIGPIELRGLTQNIVFSGATFTGMSKGDQVEIHDTCDNDGVYDVKLSNGFFCIQTGKIVVDHYFKHEVLSDASSWTYHILGRYEYEITPTQQSALSNQKYYYKTVLESAGVKERKLNQGVFCFDN